MIIKLATVKFIKTRIFAEKYDGGKPAATETIPSLGNGPVGNFLAGKKDAN